MTRKRNDNHSTEFGLWLREQKPIDSRLGYVATNLDYVWKNHRNAKWMLLEEKRYGSYMTFPQEKMFKTLHFTSQHSPCYQGFYIIIFEKTNPDDGKIFISNIANSKTKEFTKDELIKFLQFDEEVMAKVKNQ